jgi:NAD(P)-dependent dehydrogenase (short-subunit alcohol dehydrogenase family)
LITGGGGGIGLAIARAFAAAGAAVALADIDPEAAAVAAETLRAEGARVEPHELDVVDRSGWERVCDAVEASLGEIDVLVNNAGIEAIGWTVEAMPPELWDLQIAINLTGAFNGSHCVIPRLRRHGRGGHLVNMASMSGLGAHRPDHAGYVAAKHAIVGLSDSLRHELAPHGIGVSVVCPGPIATRLARSSEAVRGDRLGDAEGLAARGGEFTGAPPSLVGDAVVAAVRDKRFLVVTHPDTRERALVRFGELEAAYGRLEDARESVVVSTNEDNEI